MSTTLKFLVEGLPSEPNPGLIIDGSSGVPTTPKTGLITRIFSEEGFNSGSAVFAIIAILGALFCLVIVFTLVAKRVKLKKGFNIVSSRSTFALSITLPILGIGTIGCAGAAIGSMNYGASAATNESYYTSVGNLTAEAKLEESAKVTACATDNVRMSRAFPFGYVLNMKSSNLALESDSRIVIPKVNLEDEEDDVEAWGYSVNDSTNILPTSTELSAIYTSTTATDVGALVNVKFCADFLPDTEPGTYTATIDYDVVPTFMNYTLSYDANGGVFETAPETQTSGQTIDASYEFTITDIVPTAPADAEEGLNFYGWSVTGDSLSDVYKAGEKIVVTSRDTVLKAVWGFDVHTINYNKNTTEAVTGFVDKQYCVVLDAESSKCSVKISSRVPSMRGYTLLGWSKIAFTPTESTTLNQARAKVDYVVGDVIELSDDIDLYAVWWKVTDSDFKAELRWGENPHDIDSHLVAIRKSDGMKAFEVSFVNKTKRLETGSITIDASLDVDDVISYGPETVTLSALPASAYQEYDFYYYVYNYSHGIYGSIHTLRDSNATVSLLTIDGTTKNYDVRTANGNSADYWNVFAIKNGQVVDRNTLTEEPELLY